MVMTYFGCNLSNVNLLKCISMNNQELMKQDTQNGTKQVYVNVDQMQVFVIISKGEMKVYVGVNVNNLLIKVYVIKNLFEILVIVIVTFKK